MDSWEMLQNAFERVGQLEGEAREAFLSELQESHPAVSDELRLMLGVDPKQIRIGPIGPSKYEQLKAIENQEADGPLPERMGPYRVKQLLGRGASSLIYLVEQMEPVRRQMALKVLRTRSFGEDALARFEKEHQALALMRHKNVAHVYSCGVHDDNRPYFCMEYIQGQAIDDYCAAHNLSIGERLKLMLQVCDGVLHAHQKRILHRDLKPGNILVEEASGSRNVKVLDFGLAKSFGEALSQGTAETVMGSFLGTPAFMSPEQARGASVVDTRADIYSLGAILYNLVTGSHLVELDEDASVQELIEEVEAGAGSSAWKFLNRNMDLSSLAKERSTDPAGLKAQVKGDLDAVIGKCLEKEPEDRYDSVSQFRDDLANLIKGHHVSVRSPSPVERFQRFVSHHRKTVALATLCFMSLIFALGLALHGAHQARAAAEAMSLSKAELERNLEKKQALLKMMETVIAGMHPNKMPGDATSNTVLDDLEQVVVLRFAQYPELRQSALYILARGYYGWGYYGRAAELVSRLKKGALDREMRVDLLELAAQIELNLSNREAAEADIFQALSLHRELKNEKDISWYLKLWRLEATLGEVLHLKGHSILATSISENAFTSLGEHLGESEETAYAAVVLANTLQSRRNYKEALPLYECAHGLQVNFLGKNHPRSLVSRHNQAVCLHQLRRYQEAARIYTQVWERRKRVLGRNHKHTLSSKLGLALSLARIERLKEARKLCEEVYETYRKDLGATHGETLRAQSSYANLLYRSGLFEDAVPEYEAVLRAYEERNESQSSAAAIVASNLGDTLLRLDLHDKAIPWLEQALAAKIELFGEKARTVKVTRDLLTRARTAP